MKILKGSLVLFKAVSKHNLYVCTALKSENHAFSIESEKVYETKIDENVKNSTMLWHSRLGHMSNRGIKILNDSGAFKNDCVFEIDFCERCLAGKQHRVSFQSSGSCVIKSSRILEYLHTDV